MAHTPGPWRVHRNKRLRPSKIESKEGRLCTFHTCDPNIEANARLIAVAPELLEALEATIEWVGSLWPELESLDDWRQTVSKIVAKAKGKVK